MPLAEHPQCSYLKKLAIYTTRLDTDIHATLPRDRHFEAPGEVLHNPAQ